MNEIRTIFNNIVLTKFKQMPKMYKKNEKILKLFNDTVLDLSAIDKENKKIDFVERFVTDELSTFIFKAHNVASETRVASERDSDEKEPQSPMRLLSRFAPASPIPLK